MYAYKKNTKGKIKKILLIILIPFILLVLAYGGYKLFFIPAPEVKGLDALKVLPRQKTLTITGKNIQKLQIIIKQGSRSKALVDFEGDEAEKDFTLKVSPRKLGLSDGMARLYVFAKNGLLKKKELTFDIQVDTKPPVLQVLRSPFQIKSGGVGLALLRAKGADRVYVKEGSHLFIAYALEKTPEEYVVLFPARYDIDKKAVFYAVAEDRAGNQTVKALRTIVKPERFRSSRIRISDAFVQRVVYPLLGEEDGDPVQAFREVNEQWRKRDTERLHKIGTKSINRPLWKGRFLQLKNSKVMAYYGDRRTYIYDGRPISKSIHLGYDLASVSNAPVPAANSGVVAFADDLGIYGNAVVIDHGLGLMSLYGHLSEIKVKPGQKVKKGEIIAYTGSTGFAGGDHLHFGILVQGFEVSPLYFWDARWVRNNLRID